MNEENETMEDQAVAEESGPGKVEVLVKRLSGGLDDLASLYDLAGIQGRRVDAENLRLAWWEGQTPDGKKHPEKRPKGKVFPFEGSSDARIMLVDEVVTEKAALYALAFWSAEIQTQAFNVDDLGESTRVTALLKWIRDKSQRARLSSEILYLGNIVEGDDPGVAGVCVSWEKEISIERVTVTREMLEGLIMKLKGQPAVAPGGGEELGESIEGLEPGEADDEIMEDLVIPALLQAYDHLTEESARAALKEIREDGEADLALPVVKRNYPKIKVYRLWDDLWVDPYVDCFEEAPYVFLRERLFEYELRQRVVSQGWDEDWVDELIENGAGKFREFGTESEGLSDRAERLRTCGEKRKIFEVWRCWEKRAEFYTGLPEVWETVWSPEVKGKVALEEPQPYLHGEYRFTLVRREKIDSGMVETRGAPHIIGTHQAEIKTLRDTRNDYAQLMTIPPYKRKKRAGAVSFVLNPGGELAVERSDDFEWLTPPNAVGLHTSDRLENVVRSDVDRVMGRPTPAGSPRAATLEQVSVDHFLSSLCPVFTQAAQLCIQYFEPDELADIVGEMAEGERLEPKGLIDLAITFDTRNLDMEFLQKKMGLIRDFVLSLDTQGLLDRTIVKALMRMIDPALADRYVQSSQSVTEREVDDAMSNLAMMLVGLEPRMHEGGKNFGLQLQTIQQAIQSSPKVMETIQGDPDGVGKVIQNHLQQLQFQVQQEENKVIGRRGAQAVTAGPAN